MFFERAKDIREEKELKQQVIADIIKVDRPIYSMIETGVRIIPLNKLVTLSNFYGISIDYICGLTNDRTILYNHDYINQEVIAKKIYLVRKKMKLNQVELAKKLNVTSASISRHEKGKVLIQTLTLYELSKISGYSMDWFCSDKAIELVNREGEDDNMNLITAIKRNIKKYRIEKGIDLEEVAKKMELDVEAYTFLEDENVLRPLNIEIILKISKILDVPMHMFFIVD